MERPGRLVRPFPFGLALAALRTRGTNPAFADLLADGASAHPGLPVSQRISWAQAGHGQDRAGRAEAYRQNTSQEHLASSWKSRDALTVGMTGQDREKVLPTDGTPKEVALCCVATDPPCGFERLLRLDAFGTHIDLEALGHGHGCREYLLEAHLCRTTHQPSIDFQPFDFQVCNRLDGRVTSTEIVYHKSESGLSKSMQGSPHALAGLPKHHSFEHLDDNARWRYAKHLADADQAEGKVLVGER